MDNPQATKLLIKELNYLTTLPLPIPSDIQIVSPTKDIPSTPRLLEILEHSRNKEVANLNFLIDSSHAALA